MPVNGPSAAVGRVAVVGAGLMGHGIAQVFSVAGVPVSLQDVSDEALNRGLAGIRQNLVFLGEHGAFDGGRTEEVLGRIEVTTDRERAVDGADLVVECVFEDLGLKQEVFAELDALCPPETMLATNTSVISVTEIASAATHRERIVGTHFWNPPYLVPLVEVVRGDETSDRTMEWTFDVLAAVGKRPVRVQKDVPGFLANRLQHALWREAISIVERGIADAATVDEAIRYGFGMRLPALGPLENADLVGLDLTLAIHDYILPHLEDSHEPSPALRERVQAGDLGFKTGRGFQAWTEEEQAAVRRRMMEHLVRATGETGAGSGPGN